MSNPSGDFTLLYTQSQMDAMTARATALERERCAKYVIDHPAAEPNELADLLRSGE